MSAPSSGEEKKKIKKLHPPVEADVDPEFQIAPMIDILLVLLVFFMSISSTEVLRSNADINLPIAKDAKDPLKVQGGKIEEIVVNIAYSLMTNTSTIEVDMKNRSLEELEAMLKAKVERAPTTRVLIRADKGVRYEFLRTVLEVAGRAGVDNVTFSVADKEGAPAPSTAQH